MSMVAILLIAIGIGDLMRPLTSRAWPPALLAPALVVIGAALCGLWHRGDLVLGGIAVVAAAAWESSCTAADKWRDARQALPLIAFPGTILILFLLSGLASPIGGPARAWLTWADPAAGLSAGRLAMVAGVVLLQIGTGNQVVRLLLKSVGAVKPTGQPQPSDRLKGGRLLGPMERLLILGLGLAGQLSVATAVIAAKSIIRFPEINAQKAKREGDISIDIDIDIDDITEYFLIGSFASWIVALGGLALTAAR